MADLHKVIFEKPKSTDEMLAIIRSILDAAVADEMIYLSVEYKFRDGRMNSYSISQT